jgi:hypothetical protein
MRRIASVDCPLYAKPLKQQIGPHPTPDSAPCSQPAPAPRRWRCGRIDRQRSRPAGRRAAPPAAAGRAWEARAPPRRRRPPRRRATPHGWPAPRHRARAAAAASRRATAAAAAAAAARARQSLTRPRPRRPRRLRPPTSRPPSPPPCRRPPSRCRRRPPSAAAASWARSTRCRSRRSLASSAACSWWQWWAGGRAGRRGGGAAGRRAGTRMDARAAELQGAGRQQCVRAGDAGCRPARRRARARGAPGGRRAGPASARPPATLWPSPSLRLPAGHPPARPLPLPDLPAVPATHVPLRRHQLDGRERAGRGCGAAAGTRQVRSPPGGSARPAAHDPLCAVP